MVEKMRLDVALVRRGLAPSRERAQEAIRSGMVLVGGIPNAKPSYLVCHSDELAVTGDPIGYVGRGGQKLEKALDRFGISPEGLVCLDVGSSTGGFTDCLLRRGARRVYAVDVGREQLHPDLRHDPRVVVMEETDIRTVTSLPEAPVLASIDVSFISLTQVLPAVVQLVAPGGTIIALIKPQFEVGPGRVGKKGIVKDPRQHQAAIERVLAGAQTLELQPGDVIQSPILGSQGNREFLVQLHRCGKQE